MRGVPNHDTRLLNDIKSFPEFDYEALARSLPASTGAVECTSVAAPEAGELFGASKPVAELHPSESEFCSPLDYVGQVEVVARDTGGVLVVPPEQWKCPTVIDTTVLSLVGREQPEAPLRDSGKGSSSRSKRHVHVDFPKSIVLSYVFVNKKPVDLLLIKQWIKLCDERGMSDAEMWSLAAQYFKLDVNSLQKAYAKYDEMDDAPVSRSRHSSTPSRTSKRVKRQATGPRCKVCNQDSTPFITCFVCQSKYHYECLDAPFAAVTDTRRWQCNVCLPEKCVVSWKEVDYQCLSSFHRHALDSYDDLAGYEHPQDDGLQCLPKVEQVFWRALQSGAGRQEAPSIPRKPLRAIATGKSGFPATRQQPYFHDPWNLHHLLYSKHSEQFSYTGWKQDPMSMFALHYHHFGAPKTWYIIADEDASKFEDLRYRLAQKELHLDIELLVQSESLFALSILRENGIRIHRVVQQPGQFVITYPHTYYSTVSHGFNLTETLPFSTKEWITEQFAHNAFEQAKQFHIPAPFSMDHILLANATLDKSVKTALWLQYPLKERIDRELSSRSAFRKDHKSVVWKSIPANASVMACSFCKTFAYLAVIESRVGDMYSCIDHCNEVFSCSDKELIVYARYKDEDLNAAYDQVINRAIKNQLWLKKYEQINSSDEKPALKTLKSLLAEAESMSCALPEVDEFRERLKVAQSWVDQAHALLRKKSVVRRDKRKLKKKVSTSSPQSGSPSPSESPSPTLPVDESVLLFSLAEDSKNLQFECPEIHEIAEKANAVRDFQAKARSVKPNELTYEVCSSILEEGRALQLQLPQLSFFERKAEQLEWLENSKSLSPENTSLEELTIAYEHGKTVNISPDNEQLSRLSELLERSNDWQQRAETLLKQDVLPVTQLDALEKEAPHVCVNTDMLERIRASLKTTRALHSQLIEITEASQDPDFYKRPFVENVKAVLASADDLPSKPEEFNLVNKLLTKTYEWVRKGKKLFGKANAPLEIFKQHLEFVERRDTVAMADEGEDAPFLVGTDVPYSTTGDRSSVHYCFCRMPESGLMIECSYCHEWYHCKCMKMSKKKLKEDEKFVCPICDYRVEIPRHSNRPRLEELASMVDEVLNLPFQPIELDLLKRVVTQAKEFHEKVRAVALNSLGLTSQDLPLIRFYLRKMEGGEILMTEETNIFRQKLHELAPLAPTPPPFIGESKSNRKPRPTKRQREIMEQVASGKLTSAEGAAAIAATQSRNQSKSVSSTKSVKTLHQPLSPWTMKGIAQNALFGKNIPSASDLLVSSFSSLRSTPSEMSTVSPALTKASAMQNAMLSANPMTSGGTSFCICRQAFSISDGMVQCQSCSEWFHYDCVGLTAAIVATIVVYMCPSCCTQVGKAYPWECQPRSVNLSWESEVYPPSVLQGTTENIAVVTGSLDRASNLFDQLMPTEMAQFTRDNILQDNRPDLFTETYLNI
ncbi:multi-copy suppressor-Chk1 [Schizosaccharomyces japonicus yFS275]|uniref:Multi-copy suppressor-Chk1 n=1 Tax=Schizosaccharomyces japonicus (strain yFS275 / FY16936) TaxID=402676 RepID=B6JY05_SCHJY|nr:multi-copy suppressor-Chk1 [Schizosaccharomyces japonicus yFS275]EEB06423.2 multi-copy suppressor-Chk1 [Schizosaccharomyces japonicus yFS275]